MYHIRTCTLRSIANIYYIIPIFVQYIYVRISLYIIIYSISAHFSVHGFMCSTSPIQHTPPSDSTSAPASNCHPPLSCVRAHQRSWKCVEAMHAQRLQWHLSTDDTTGTQLAVLYTVEPLYSGHHWDPAGCPV